MNLCRGWGRKSPWVWVPLLAPLPQMPPEPTGDGGPPDPIAGTARIGVGVDEGVDARWLIGFEVFAALPGYAVNEDEGQQDDGYLFEVDST